MTSTEFSIGLKESGRISSKVLKPPGGDSHDIFNVRIDQEPKKDCPKRHDVHTDGDTNDILFGVSFNKPHDEKDSKEINKPSGCIPSNLIPGEKQILEETEKAVPFDSDEKCSGDMLEKCSKKISSADYDNAKDHKTKCGGNDDVLSSEELELESENDGNASASKAVDEAGSVDRRDFSTTSNEIGNKGPKFNINVDDNQSNDSERSENKMSVKAVKSSKAHYGVHSRQQEKENEKESQSEIDNIIVHNEAEIDEEPKPMASSDDKEHEQKSGYYLFQQQVPMKYTRRNPITGEVIEMKAKFSTKLGAGAGIESKSDKPDHSGRSSFW